MESAKARENTANTKPRYANSSDSPALHANATKTKVSVDVWGMIFSVNRNRNPRRSAGTRAILRRLAHWFKQRSAVRIRAIKNVRKVPDTTRPSSFGFKCREEALQDITATMSH